MRTISKLVPLVLFAGATAVQACGSIPVDTAGQFPVKGVIRGSITYLGPPPCSQNGHVVGNVVLLVFDRRNPPPPSGLGTTATNFGVVSGDVLFSNWPVTAGADKVCPDASYPVQTASAPFAIAPMDPGSYYIEAFFDYTGDFFATFTFRRLPEALDIGGGAIDLNDANSLIPNLAVPPISSTPPVYPLITKQSDPNFQPKFLNIDVGIAGSVPPTSLRGVPDFTLPPNGFVADNVQVFVGAKLPLARPYFWPEGAILPEGQQNATITIPSDGASSDQRPASAAKSPQNPDGNRDFIPVLSFPQDITIYAQPVSGQTLQNVVNDYQGSFPQLKLHAGVPSSEQTIASDVVSPTNPFHMQLGVPGGAPGGIGGIFVWWDGMHTDLDCGGVPGCSQGLNNIPESTVIKKMWPLAVLAKLNDLPAGTSEPSAADPESLVPQGTDLSKPIVIIQGITLANDTLFHTALGETCTSTDKTGADGCASSSNPNKVTNPVVQYPDVATNLQDHVTVLLRPSTVCIDPRHPDRGGIIVATGDKITDGKILGSYPPSDKPDLKRGTPGTVVDSAILSNPQLSKIINTKAAGTTNGLAVGCLPPGRYSINLVYPTGQAWTTPNEIGSCAPLEGSTQFPVSGAYDPGSCSSKPRPVLYSQGTRGVVEITPVAASSPNCKSAAPTDGSIPAVPTQCTTLPPE